MPKAHFLGTNGWFDSDSGRTVCTLLDYPDFSLILDAGGGFSRLEGVIDLEKPAYLFLSHLHLDHVAGLHTLPILAFRNDLHILIAEDSAEAFRVFQNAPYTVPRDLYGKYLNYTIRILGLPKGAEGLPFGLTTFPVVHTVETLAARVVASGRVVSYVVDTGLCENAIEAARDADLLIAECSHRPGERSREWPHLSPEEAAEIAVRASCRKLVLTHFDAKRYPTPASREVSEGVARKIFPDTVAACDGSTCTF